MGHCCPSAAAATHMTGDSLYYVNTPLLCPSSSRNYFFDWRLFPIEKMFKENLFITLVYQRTQATTGFKAEWGKGNSKWIFKYFPYTWKWLHTTSLQHIYVDSSSINTLILCVFVCGKNHLFTLVPSVSCSASFLLNFLLRHHRQNKVWDSAPQSRKFVSVHLIEGTLAAWTHQPVFDVVLHHLLHIIQMQLAANFVLRQ